MAKKKVNSDYPASQRPYDFLRLANDFYNAYKNCPETTPPNFPKYFLGCHCIELAFKSYLLRNGNSIEGVISHGHNLSSLLKACEAMGLVVSKEFVNSISMINEIHHSTGNRYPMERAIPIVLLENIDREIDKLMIDINPYSGVIMDGIG